MTEDEAKTKWCPFVRLLTEVGTGNRVLCKDVLSINDEPTNCIGSQCMAWRWNGWQDPNGRRYANKSGDRVHFGYCGLAGEVE